MNIEHEETYKDVNELINQLLSDQSEAQNDIYGTTMSGPNIQKLFGVSPCNLSNWTNHKLLSKSGESKSPVYYKTFEVWALINSTAAKRKRWPIFQIESPEFNRDYSFNWPELNKADGSWEHPIPLRIHKNSLILPEGYNSAKPDTFFCLALEIGEYGKVKKSKEQNGKPPTAPTPPSSTQQRKKRMPKIDDWFEPSHDQHPELFLDSSQQDSEMQKLAESTKPRHIWAKQAASIRFSFYETTKDFYDDLIQRQIDWDISQSEVYRLVNHGAILAYLGGIGIEHLPTEGSVARILEKVPQEHLASYWTHVCESLEDPKSVTTNDLIDAADSYQKESGYTVNVASERKKRDNDQKDKAIKAVVKKIEEALSTKRSLLPHFKELIKLLDGNVDEAIQHIANEIEFNSPSEVDQIDNTDQLWMFEEAEQIAS